MEHEKSCGAIVFRKKSDKIDLLLLKHRYGGHWSFPKGHVEGDENELQTALREVKEETGLSITVLDGFRQTVEYSPKPNVRKQVVYFLGYPESDEFKRQEEEISEIRWVSLEDASKVVNFKNNKNLIAQAKKFLMKVEK